MERRVGPPFWGERDTGEALRPHQDMGRRRRSGERSAGSGRHTHREVPSPVWDLHACGHVRTWRECSRVRKTCQRIVCKRRRGAMLSVRCRSCEPTRDDGEPSCNHVGSDADNVGRTHAPASMIVGQHGCSIASLASNECEPLHLTVEATWPKYRPSLPRGPIRWERSLGRGGAWQGPWPRQSARHD
jgi:hypothetical protein